MSAKLSFQFHRILAISLCIYFQRATVDLETHIPQGYFESPSIFSHVLKANLDSVAFTWGSTLVQYIDELLLCN